MCLCEEADTGQEELQPDDLPDFPPPPKMHIFEDLCARAQFFGDVRC